MTCCQRMGFNNYIRSLMEKKILTSDSRDPKKVYRMGGVDSGGKVHGSV